MGGCKQRGLQAQNSMGAGRDTAPQWQGILSALFFVGGIGCQVGAVIEAKNGWPMLGLAGYVLPPVALVALGKPEDCDSSDPSYNRKKWHGFLVGLTCICVWGVPVVMATAG